MRPRWTAILCLAVAASLLLAACGGDDGGGDGDLSSQEKLTVIQARADIQDFCSLYQSEPSDLFDRSFETMLTAVSDLSRVYRENPDANVEIPVERKTFTMRQIVEDQARDLRRCGSDGRQQSGVLQAALQNQ